MDSEPLKAPTYWHRLTLQQAGQTASFEQLMKDFMPSRTTVRVSGEDREVEPDITVAEIQRRFLPPGPLDCTVHLKDDLQVRFIENRNLIEIQDLAHKERVEIQSAPPNLGAMHADEAVKAAEECYLENSGQFADPYQYQDTRNTPVTFRTGSEVEMNSQVTQLLHCFPRIFELVSSPRILVFTEFGPSPASVNVRLVEQGRRYRAEGFFMKLLEQIIQANTPVGHCYRSTSGRLERRSSFFKDSQILSVAPQKPIAEQIEEARKAISALYKGEYGLSINPQVFDQSPLEPDNTSAHGNSYELN